MTTYVPCDVDNARPNPASSVPLPVVGLKQLQSVVRAERRVLDAEEEFDAALAAGLSMSELVARDQELKRATTARDALL